jgi:hypothetical protein
MLVVGCRYELQRQMAMHVDVMFIWEGEQSALG